MSSSSVGDNFLLSTKQTLGELQRSLHVQELWHVLTGETTNEAEKEDSDECYTYDYSKEFRRLQFSQEDVASITMDDKAFRRMKHSLKRHGCVTNHYISQSLHNYIRHVKEDRRQRESTS